MKRLLLFLVVLAVCVGSVWYFKPFFIEQFFGPREEGPPSGVTLELVEETEAIEVVVENLAIPWEIAFLPDGSLLVTERPGRLVRVLPESHQSVPVAGVAHVGEGGLLGLTLDPEYAQNGWIYLYSTTREGGRLTNRIERYVFDENENALRDRTVILSDIPGASNHDGGRIAFGPDGHLYITTGDAEVPDSAQSTSAVSGKILRIHKDGSVPADNPFGNAVYSYGHRNPQGLAWDARGRLWSTEHGPSGTQTGNDEVNLIQAGGNYGWPMIRGTQTAEGMIAPLLESGRASTWAPADALVVDDLLFFTGLRGQALYTARISGENLTDFMAHFEGEYGRLRAVVASPDGEWIYFSTSNTDGRGRAFANDDKIIRVKTSLFF